MHIHAERTECNVCKFLETRSETHKGSYALILLFNLKPNLFLSEKIPLTSLGIMGPLLDSPPLPYHSAVMFRRVSEGVLN